MEKPLNILIIGETGVGKSTFINALANYLSFPSFDEADRAKRPICLIPVKFHLTEGQKDILIQCGQPNKNEIHKDGQASTQHCHSYPFEVDGGPVNLIDTPGMGDPRGLETDQAHIEEIKSFLSQLEELHGVLILLKPNVSKLTEGLSYSIKWLVSFLEKTASCNVLFVFTNSRSTFYKPGDTVVPLRKLLDSIQTNNSVLNFEKSNRFCVDSEGFRYLVAKKKIRFSEEEKAEYKRSWENSVQVSLDLIKKVGGLTPHRLERTFVLGQCRKLMEDISFPLFEFSTRLVEKGVLLRGIKKRLSDLTKKEGELLEVLNSPSSRPILAFQTFNNRFPYVCGSDMCRIKCSVEGYRLDRFPQRCTPPQAMSGLFSAVSNMWTFAGYRLCKDCFCKQSDHFLQEGEYIVQHPVQYVEADHELNLVRANKTQVQSQAEEARGEVNALRAECHKLIKSAALFTCFHFQSSISGAADGFNSSLKEMIRQKSPTTNQWPYNQSSDKTEEVVFLKQLLKQYQSDFTDLMKKKDPVSIDKVKEKLAEIEKGEAGDFSVVLRNHRRLGEPSVAL